MKVKTLFLYLFLLLVISCGKEKETVTPDDPGGGTGTEQGKDPYLDLSASTLSFAADKDASLVVIRTNKEWQAACDADWITFSVSAGDNATGLLIAASPNRKFRREATVTVTADKLTRTIKVIQQGLDRIELTIRGVKFTFLPVYADTTFHLEGGLYFLSRDVYLDSYYISETEITNEQWKAVTGSLPYEEENSFPDYPVVVNWNQITGTFLPKINELTGYDMRLPTEHEWEVAASGGKKADYTEYAGSNDIDEVAWYFFNSEGRKHNVGQKKPNELGLYDMSGNVLEWTWDWPRFYDMSGKPPSSSTNPAGPASGSDKVVRGGDIFSDQFEYSNNSCKVYTRIHLPPGISTEGFLFDGFYHSPGFRLVIPKD